MLTNLIPLSSPKPQPKHVFSPGFVAKIAKKMSQVATALLALVAQQRQLLRSTWYAFYRRLSLPRRRHLKRRDAMTQLQVLLGEHRDLSVLGVELR